MAIYHLSAKVISRGKGQSIVACAAYRAGDQLQDERLGELYDYTRKQDVAHTEILLPEGTPIWMQEREKLWNAVERSEKRLDAQLAREIQVALPRELTLSQQIDLTREFVNQELVARGMIADIAIHLHPASDGEMQPHAHILLTMRDVNEAGFGKKVRAWNDKSQLLKWREQWAEYTNKHLALNGHDLRIDHRSFKEQGIDLEPQTKIGVASAFYHNDSVLQHQDIARRNGERLLEKPEIIFDILTNQQSTFTHHDIARLVNRHTLDADQFQTIYEKVKSSPELVYLGIDDKQRERFTTRQMLCLESEMIGHATALQEKEGHAIKTEQHSFAEKHGLSSEQAHVLGHVLSAGDLKCVVGFAGTGKSRLLGAAKEAWEEEGYRVLGATLSGIAAENLEASSGIDSRTLASRFHYWDKGEQLLTTKDILVIDEAGMIDSRQMKRVLTEADIQGAKVVLVGDPEQLQAIQAGAAFRAIIESTSFVELTEIWRQKSDWQKEATVQFATEQTRGAIEQYAAHYYVHEFDTGQQAKEALVDAWNDGRILDPNKTQIMLAYTRKNVYELNEMARAIRQSLGELGTDHLIQTERGERQFAEGEQIYFLKNDRELGVKNGTLGTIVGIDDEIIKVSLIKEGQAESQVIAFSTGRYNELEYGYAATIHKGQGVTVDHAYLLASQYLDRHATYVAMTRHRDGVDVYWGKDTFPSFDAMVNTLSRERNKEFSLDYLERDFAAYRGIASEGWPTFESYPEGLGQRLTDDLQIEVSPYNQSDKIVPDWHADLFYGFDKKVDTKKDFSDLFYGLNVDLSKNEKSHPIDCELGNDKEVDI